MIECSECRKLSHLKCAGKNVKTKKYLCSICQLIKMDPFNVPVLTIIEPFIVYKYQDLTEDINNPSFPSGAAKSF